jgi:hypothetical protein
MDGDNASQMKPIMDAMADEIIKLNQIIKQLESEKQYLEEQLNLGGLNELRR